MEIMQEINYTALIKLFNCCIVDNTCNEDPTELNKYAMKRGYVVHPDVCNTHVRRFLDDVAVNPNATFYKTVEEVTSKNRLELLVDQLIHYMTTYGTDFALGNGFVPNDMDFSEVPDWTSFKTIAPVTESELYGKCIGMLQSGVALNKNTMTAVSDYVIYYAKKNSVVIDVDAVRNREAVVYLCDNLGIAPKKPDMLFRYIIYRTSGETMVVKNDNLFKMISIGMNNARRFDMRTLDSEQIAGLSTIFYRYKMLFCALKRNCNGNAAVVNKIRKLAVRNHKPAKSGFWQTIFSVKRTAEEMQARLGELTNYKKVSLMQLCKERTNRYPDQLYTIRNRKTFVRENYTPDTDADYALLVYDILRKSLVESVSKHSTKTVLDENGNEVEKPLVVKTAEGVMVPLPVSEKAFIGNYPCGTTYRLTENNYICCYWRNEWGTNDYDLSFLDSKMNKIGWNSDFYDDNVTFSGDMTNADPEAAEVIFIKKNTECPSGFITVNQFSGRGGKSKFRMMFGQENIENLDQNYMVDPNTIRLNVEIEHEHCSEISVGIIDSDAFVLINTNNGQSRVSEYNKWTLKKLDTMIVKSKFFCDSVPVLDQAGFQIVGPDYEGEVDIDFTNLSKDSLTALMA